MQIAPKIRCLFFLLHNPLNCINVAFKMCIKFQMTCGDKEQHKKMAWSLGVSE